MVPDVPDAELARGIGQASDFGEVDGDGAQVLRVVAPRGTNAQHQHRRGAAGLGLRPKLQRSKLARATVLGGDAGATIRGEPAVVGKVEAVIVVIFEAVWDTTLERDHRASHGAGVGLVDAHARDRRLAVLADRGKLDRARGAVPPEALPWVVGAVALRDRDAVEVLSSSSSLLARGKGKRGGWSLNGLGSVLHKCFERHSSAQSRVRYHRAIPHLGKAAAIGGPNAASGRIDRPAGSRHHAVVAGHPPPVPEDVIGRPKFECESTDQHTKH